MNEGIDQANLENCIYCGACFKYCVLKAYEELDGMELKSLVSGVTRIARRGYNEEKDKKVKSYLDRCSLQGECDKVCPTMVKPSLRNKIAKKRIEEGR
jgi:L-lactate utilization protein LutB